MPLFKKRKETRDNLTIANPAPSLLAWLNSDDFMGDAERLGYTSLKNCPEIITACRVIAEQISNMTLYLMANTDRGDVRIVNELSYKLDINPNPNYTRKLFIMAVVMNLLLYGDGNSVVLPHTNGGILTELEPVEPSRVVFYPEGKGYYLTIDGIRYEPDEVLHFRLNPDPHRLWLGQGIKVSGRLVSDSLAKTTRTVNDFNSRQYKPNVIIKVDASDEGFASPEGRGKLLDSYFKSRRAGEPWLIPMDKFDVTTVKPLTLQDLAINDTITDLKEFAAAVVGVPPFCLGVGAYNKEQWNNFIQTSVRSIATELQQEMTSKLILSPKWYLKFNTLSLYDYSITDISAVYGGLYNQGIITGNEVRDRLGLEPLDGLDELVRLENYIPISETGNQKKLQD
jgi:HK97 family phage portal protein